MAFAGKFEHHPESKGRALDGTFANSTHEIKNGLDLYKVSTVDPQTLILSEIFWWNGTNFFVSIPGYEITSIECCPPDVIVGALNDPDKYPQLDYRFWLAQAYHYGLKPRLETETIKSDFKATIKSSNGVLMVSLHIRKLREWIKARDKDQIYIKKENVGDHQLLQDLHQDLESQEAKCHCRMQPVPPKGSIKSDMRPRRIRSPSRALDSVGDQGLSAVWNDGPDNILEVNSDEVYPMPTRRQESREIPQAKPNLTLHIQLNDNRANQSDVLSADGHGVHFSSEEIATARRGKQRAVTSTPPDALRQVHLAPKIYVYNSIENRLVAGDTTNVQQDMRRSLLPSDEEEAGLYPEIALHLSTELEDLLRCSKEPDSGYGTASSAGTLSSLRTSQDLECSEGERAELSVKPFNIKEKRRKRELPGQPAARDIADIHVVGTSDVESPLEQADYGRATQVLLASNPLTDQNPDSEKSVISAAQKLRNFLIRSRSQSRTNDTQSNGNDRASKQTSQKVTAGGCTSDENTQKDNRVPSSAKHPNHNESVRKRKSGSRQRTRIQRAAERKDASPAPTVSKESQPPERPQVKGPTQKTVKRAQVSQERTPEATISDLVQGREQERARFMHDKTDTYAFQESQVRSWMPEDEMEVLVLYKSMDRGKYIVRLSDGSTMTGPFPATLLEGARRRDQTETALLQGLSASAKDHVEFARTQAKTVRGPKGTQWLDHIMKDRPARAFQVMEATLKRTHDDSHPGLLSVEGTSTIDWQRVPMNDTDQPPIISPYTYEKRKATTPAGKPFATKEQQTNQRSAELAEIKDRFSLSASDDSGPSLPDDNDEKGDHSSIEDSDSDSSLPIRHTPPALSAKNITGIATNVDGVTSKRHELTEGFEEPCLSSFPDRQQMLKVAEVATSVPRTHTSRPAFVPKSPSAAPAPSASTPITTARLSKNKYQNEKSFRKTNALNTTSKVASPSTSGRNVLNKTERPKVATTASDPEIETKSSNRTFSLSKDSAGFFTCFWRGCEHKTSGLQELFTHATNDHFPADQCCWGNCHEKSLIDGHIVGKHMYHHVPYRVYMCRLCGQDFARGHALYCHFKSRHPDQKPNTEAPSIVHPLPLDGSTKSSVDLEFARRIFPDSICGAIPNSGPTDSSNSSSMNIASARHAASKKYFPLSLLPLCEEGKLRFCSEDELLGEVESRLQQMKNNSKLFSSAALNQLIKERQELHGVLAQIRQGQMETVKEA